MRYEVGEENDAYIYIYDNERKRSVVELSRDMAVNSDNGLTREDAAAIAALLNDQISLDPPDSDMRWYREDSVREMGVKHTVIEEHLPAILKSLEHDAERLDRGAGDNPMYSSKSRSQMTEEAKEIRAIIKELTHG